MLKYNSTLPSIPAYSGQQQAKDTMRAPSPFTAFGSAHDDILRARGDTNAAAFDMAAGKANAEQEMSRMQAQRDLILRGLQQMSEAQQNHASIGNARLQGVSGLLSGLFT